MVASRKKKFVSLGIWSLSRIPCINKESVPWALGTVQGPGSWR